MKSPTVALVHAPSPRLAAGERTHVARDPIDIGLAQAQHGAFCRALADCGLKVRSLDANRDEPDGVFIEDTAIVLDEVAVISSMGTAARRNEPRAIEPVLAEYRPVRRIELPATIEGGDVLRVGRDLVVGLSSRTNAAGIEALDSLARPLEYAVYSVEVRGCLHLKTACTALPDGRLLVNPDWLDVSALGGRRLVEIPAKEPWGANTLPIGTRVVLPSAHQQTAALIRGLGFDPLPVDITELAKAEGGVTCLSLLMPEHPENRHAT
jgi:dimethylargininase